MIWDIVDFLVDFFELGVFFYCTGILLSYWIISVVSYKVVRSYIKETEKERFDELMGTPFLPSIYIIAPAYNESVTIFD